MSSGFTINKLFAYLIAFFLLLDGSNMWQLTGSEYLATMTVRLFIIAVCLISVLATFSIRKVQISYHFLRNMTVISILFGILWLGTRFNFIYFFRVQYVMFMIFTLYIYVLMKYGLIKDLVKAFINIWLVISIVTTFFWIFSSVFPIIPLKSINYYWAERILPSSTFFKLYFQNTAQALKLNGVLFYRNTGIYAEAPGIGSYFLYAIGLELSFLKKDKGHKFRLWALTLTSFTTLSTKTLIMVPILLLLAYIFNAEGQTRTGMVNVFRLFLYVLGIAVVGYFVYNQLTAKSDTGSYSIRVDDVNAALKVFKTSPFFGVGLGNTQPIIQNFTVSRNNNGLSMGLTLLLAQGGIWLTTMYLMPLILMFIRFFKSKENRKFLIFGIAVFMNLVISNIISGPSFLIIVAAGYAYFNLTEDEKQEMLLGIS